MPVVSNSNNRILPANSRAADVASRAVDELTSVQQTRYMNAFRVQGYSGILYNHLLQGKKCTCQASRKHLNTRLNTEGKASQGAINRLLTGQDTFDVTPYNSGGNYIVDPFSNVTSPSAPIDKFQGQFDIVKKNEDDYPIGTVINGEAFGDNGPINTDVDIDTLFGDFDSSTVGITDAACGVCFGMGFIGGYSPFHANRQVYTVADVILGEGNIDFLKKPWTATSTQFFISTVLPLGALGFDAFRVMNNIQQVSATFKIDNVLITNHLLILKFCDGKTHLIEVNLQEDTEWTHVELQFNLTYESAYFEFPKLTKGSDTSKLDQLDPFQIILSPNIPNVRSQDIIVESTFGKTLIIQNSNWWNSRNRAVLGWECTVRVIQPQEIYRALPVRGRVKTKNETTNTQHDNVTGPRRT